MITKKYLNRLTENVPDADIILTARPNNGTGEIVDSAEITPMKITMPDTIYAGVSFTLNL